MTVFSVFSLVLVILFIFVFFYFIPIGLWISATAAGVKVSFLNLIDQ